MSNQRINYNIELKTSDPSLLVNLFGEELPDEGTEFSLDTNAIIKAQNVKVQHGFIETSIVVNCILQVIGGITIKVVGDLLVEHFKDKKAKLSINGKKIENITSSEIESALSSEQND